MYRIAVGRDRGVADRAIRVGQVAGFGDALRTALDGFIIGVVCVFDLKRDIADAVAVLLDVLGGRVLRHKRRRQHKIDAVLPEHVARHLAVARLKPAISKAGKPKSLAVIKLRLLRVTNVKLNVMYLL